VTLKIALAGMQYHHRSMLFMVHQKHEKKSYSIKACPRENGGLSSSKWGRGTQKKSFPLTTQAYRQTTTFATFVSLLPASYAKRVPVAVYKPSTYPDPTNQTFGLTGSQ
jgi:hypothetical protein